MKNSIEILKNNIDKEVTISAGYNDSRGKIIEVSPKGWVSIKLNKREIKYIDISKIYEITEDLEK